MPPEIFYDSFASGRPADRKGFEPAQSQPAAVATHNGGVNPDSRGDRDPGLTSHGKQLFAPVEPTGVRRMEFPVTARDLG